MKNGDGNPYDLTSYDGLRGYYRRNKVGIEHYLVAQNPYNGSLIFPYSETRTRENLYHDKKCDTKFRNTLG